MEIKLKKEDENLYRLYLKKTDVWLTVEEMVEMGFLLFSALEAEEKTNGERVQQQANKMLKGLRPHD